MLDHTTGHRPANVWFHLRDYGADTRFRRRGRQWVATIPRPPVNRLEYLVVYREPHGHEWMAPDPQNPRRSRGVFGDHSLLEFPEYVRPGWLDRPDPGGRTEPFHVDDPRTGVGIGGGLWTPGGVPDDTALPLLVAHDGPEYADLGGLLRYAAHLADDDPRLACRVLLLQPEDRNRIYSASPAYTRMLVELAVPEVTKIYPTVGSLVGIGASLGALALAHAAVTHPGVFGGLYLQSGSFFRQASDPQEQRFRYYDRVVRFVQELDINPEPLRGVTLTFTCGTGEENLANNRALVARLHRRGIGADFIENADGHNYTGWRDCLDPGLGNLLRRLW